MDTTELLFVVIIGLLIVYLFVSLSGPAKIQMPNFSTSTANSTQNVGKSLQPTVSKLQEKFGSTSSWNAILDKYESVEQVQEALREAGLESCNLIVGVDYTKSNETSGRVSFQGKCLHALSAKSENPYQQVISILGRTLEVFDEDKKIPVYGFGDVTTKGVRVFPFFPDRPCLGFEEVLSRYNEVTPHIQLSGPTNFAPLIYEAINIVKTAKDFHLLVIVADGLVTSEKETVAAIVEASKYPLAILMIGVGDGPFDLMKDFDDNLPERKFDNFQFVNFNAVMKITPHPDTAFALHALMEVPDQYKLVKRLGLL